MRRLQKARGVRYFFRKEYFSGQQEFRLKAKIPRTMRRSLRKNSARHVHGLMRKKKSSKKAEWKSSCQKKSSRTNCSRNSKKMQFFVTLFLPRGLFYDCHSIHSQQQHRCILLSFFGLPLVERKPFFVIGRNFAIQEVARFTGSTRSQPPQFLRVRHCLNVLRPKLGGRLPM